MYINIQPQEFEMTDAERAYALEKFGMLKKYYDHIEEIRCELGMKSHKHNKGRIYTCNAHLFVRGHDFFVEKEEEDLYKAIDKVKDHLQDMLIKWKEKSREKEGEQIEE